MELEVLKRFPDDYQKQLTHKKMAVRNRKVSSSNFVDYVKICCRSGHGGAGSTHLRREKHVAMGGPDGGDGGRGGHIILRANSQLWTLIHLKYRKHVVGKHGEKGSKQKSSGADGEDVIIDVPVGTVIRDPETMEIEYEMVNEGEQRILVPGGRGGQGNWHFRSAVNQTPRYAQDGELGKEEWRILELKVLADVGLVGFPNAGKSTLLASISGAKPEIANYAFTTMTPNLGIVPYRNDRSFVMADIPGIIEGAHEGKGIGHRFLRHIERNSVLLFMIPVDTDDIQNEYKILVNELEQYNPELVHKRRILALTKSDMIDDELKAEIILDLPEIEYCFISAVSNVGLEEVKDLIWNAVNQTDVEWNGSNL